LFGVTEQTGDLAEGQPGFGKVSRRQSATLLIYQVLTSHTLGDQAPLQRPWVHRKLIRDCVDAALAGG
jgi:hypothetical protein